MKLNTYLNFNGDCREAFEFYAELLGGKIKALMTFADMPGCPSTPAEKDKIMHAELELGSDTLMGTDSTMLYPHQPIKCAYVVVQPEQPAEAERIYTAFAEGGKVEMAIQETFWAHRWGIVVDRFGVPWMVNCLKAA